MNIDTLVVGALQANCYLVSTDNKCIIIDPGADENFIISKIQNLGLEPVGIILTHDHNDHVVCSETLKNMYNVEVYDYNTLFQQKHYLEPFKFKVIYTPGILVLALLYIFMNMELCLRETFYLKMI